MRASVLLPFRDADATLDVAIRSVLAEPGDFELLAIDDGSVDGSLAIARACARADDRVRILRTGGTGLVGALALGLDEARAPIVVRMDADDRHRAPRVAALADALERDPGLGIVGTAVELAANAPIGEGLARYVQWQNAILSADAHAREVFVESPLCHPTFAMRVETLRAVGGYRDGPFPEDYDLVLRMHRAGHRLVKLPFVGLEWTHREGRLTFRDPRYSVDAFRRLKVEHLVPLLEAAGRPTYVWGAGRDGRRFTRALLDAGLVVDALVDIDPRKIGRTAYGIRIVGMDSLPSPADAFVVVAVGTRGARALIRDALVARGYLEIEDFRCVA